MTRKRHKPEEIVVKLRQVDVLVAQGKPVADAIRSLADRHAAVLLANHGPVVSGASLDGAVNAIEELEETAKLLLTLGDRPVRPLDETQIEELRRVFGAEW